MGTNMSYSLPIWKMLAPPACETIVEGHHVLSAVFEAFKVGYRGSHVAQATKHLQTTRVSLTAGKHFGLSGRGSDCDTPAEGSSPFPGPAPRPPFGF